MKKIIYSFIIILNYFVAVAQQDSTRLHVGDKAPSLVLPTRTNEIQSFGFPYKNKVVLLLFWSSSVAASQENLYKYAKINARYRSLEFKACNGFEMISVAIQSDRITWEEDVKKFNMANVNNCIALKGFKEFFIKPYKLSETPTSFLIDELGKVIFVNPDIRSIMGYLDTRKNVLQANEPQNSIAGKVLIGEDVRPLKNSKVYVLNTKKDTVQTVTTNDAGTFYVKNVNTSQDLNLNISKSPQIGEDDKVFLASENGEILTAMKKTETGFEYNVLDVEMVFLKPLKEEHVTLKNTKELKDLSFTQNLFPSGGINLTKDAKDKLDALLDKLKVYPKARIEIISHTDCKGDAKTNDALSLKRSVSVANYFISKGIDKTRIKTFGKGEQELLNDCADGIPCSQAENEINRRTVFRFYQSD